MYDSKNHHLYVEAINRYKHARIDPESILTSLAFGGGPGRPVTLTIERNPAEEIQPAYLWALTWTDEHTKETHTIADPRLDKLLWLAQVTEKASWEEHKRPEPIDDDQPRLL